MKPKLFYYIPFEYVGLIPREAYKDNCVLITYTGDWPSLDYTISLDIKDYPLNTKFEFFTHLYLRNLHEKDFTHLNILGIPIKQHNGIRIPRLPLALKHKSTRFTASKVWKRIFYDPPK